jgi:hypothetical protein
MSSDYILKKTAMSGTIKCVFCGKKAISWGGHVIRDGEAIIAGWCKKHTGKNIPPGFYGHYKRWMGGKRA